MLNIKDFGMSGNFILIFIILLNLSVTFSKCINEPGTDYVLKEKMYIGMQEHELLKYMEEAKWRIIPKTRLFAAKKINGKDYSFEFFLICKEKPDSIKILLQLICKHNIRVLNNYCVLCDTVKVNNITNKNIPAFLRNSCKKIIDDKSDKANKILDSLVILREKVMQIQSVNE